MPAAVASLIVGSAIRLSFFFIMPEDITEFPYAGLDTMIPPIIAFALFYVVALATQSKYPGKARHDVRDYVPPEEDVIAGEDLKHFKGGSEAMPGGSDSNASSPDEDISSKNAT
jgi:hypothetical protein